MLAAVRYGQRRSAGCGQPGLVRLRCLAGEIRKPAGSLRGVVKIQRTSQSEDVDVCAKAKRHADEDNSDDSACQSKHSVRQQHQANDGRAATKNSSDVPEGAATINGEGANTSESSAGQDAG